MLNVKKQKQNKKTGRKWTRVTTFTAKGPHQWNICGTAQYIFLSIH